jgi:hypothetical protein
MSDTMTTEQRMEAELAGEIPEGWTYKVGGTTNTITVRARRPSDGAHFDLQTDRRNPLPDVREFVQLCRLLDR